MAYSVTMSDTTIVADATLVIIHTATGLSAGNVIEIERAWVGQRGTDTSDQLGILIARKESVFPTVTSTTPVNHTIGGPASGITGGTAGAAGTSGVDASAEGAGTVTTIIADSFNNLNGWLWVPTPEERIILNPDTAIILKLVGTPGTLTNWYAGITYRELS